MRFRLHSQDSSGQAKQNKTAIAALSLQVEGKIHIVTGVNDTFIFKHVAVTPSNPTETYTLVLSEQSYTVNEMLTALNAAIASHGNVANLITTTITVVNGNFVVRCTSAEGIEHDNHPWNRHTILYGVRVAGVCGRTDNRADCLRGFKPRRDKHCPYRHCFTQ